MTRCLEVATVPTVYGIETPLAVRLSCNFLQVATVPTVYGIETPDKYAANSVSSLTRCNSTYRLRY